MNVSKTLSSAVAAATIVGAVGLAYAQTTSDPATRPADSTMNSTAPSTQRQLAGDDAGDEQRQHLVDHAVDDHDDDQLERQLGRRAVQRPPAEGRPELTANGHRPPRNGAPMATQEPAVAALQPTELRSDLWAGLKQGVLLAAAALVLTLPPGRTALPSTPRPSRRPRSTSSTALISLPTGLGRRPLHRRLGRRFGRQPWPAVHHPRQARCEAIRLRRRRPADRFEPGPARRRLRATTRSPTSAPGR